MIRLTQRTAFIVFAMLALVLLVTSPQEISAQGVSAQAKKARVRRPPPKPKFDDISLTTRDGVSLQCTYYPGPESKETVPMILVHDWGGNRGELHPIALWMQQELKLTVIAPDLRGHGHSTHAVGIDETIDRDKLKGRAIDAMVWDLEACKSHLLKENNGGKLNIEQLGVMGTGFGACLALKWAVQDWSVRNLPTYKQGWDVKGLILVSPSRSFRGSTINTDLKKLAILRNISALILVGGEDARAMSDAQRIHKTFERAWGDESKQAAPFVAAATTLQSTDLVKAPGTGTSRFIRTFIERRLVERGAQFPWTDRTSPLR